MNIAMISYHTCPLATLGGKDTGGMNVYVREVTRQLGRRGVHVDVFTRSQDEHVPHVLHELFDRLRPRPKVARDFRRQRDEAGDQLDRLEHTLGLQLTPASHAAMLKSGVVCAAS